MELQGILGLCIALIQNLTGEIYRNEIPQNSLLHSIFSIGMEVENDILNPGRFRPKILVEMQIIQAYLGLSHHPG
jgi:hypothetical protein